MMNDELEKYIQSILDYAKGNKIIMDAIKTLGMTWGQYEFEIRKLLTPRYTFINTTSNTNNTPYIYSDEVAFVKDGDFLSFREFRASPWVKVLPQTSIAACGEEGKNDDP